MKLLENMRIFALVQNLFNVVGATGFEPILAESESDVLPLNYAPKRTILYTRFSHFAIFFCLNRLPPKFEHFTFPEHRSKPAFWVGVHVFL